jgi:hypothetical protein
MDESYLDVCSSLRSVSETGLSIGSHKIAIGAGFSARGQVGSALLLKVV